MIEFNLDNEKSILHIKPQSALQTEDFLKLANVLDPYLNQRGQLKGIVIETPKFPGWKNFNAFKSHLQFVKSHHKKINRIAVATDSKLADIGVTLGGFFLAPQLKRFPYNQVGQARQWLEESQPFTP